MEAAMSTVSENNPAFDVLDSCREHESYRKFHRQSHRNTFNITYDPVDVFILVAGEDCVGGRIELVQGAGSDLKRHRELHTRPVVFACIELLDVAWTLSEILVVLQQGGENVVLVLGREANGVDFLLLFQCDDELIGILEQKVN
jgi:hypothetical protein